MSNNSYWENRQNAGMTNALESSSGTASILLEGYQKALQAIEKELLATVQKYDLEKSEWYKRMTKREYKDIQELYDDMISSGVPREITDKFINGIIKANRLEALQKQVEAQIIKLHQELNTQIEEHIKDIYQSAYDDISNALGIDLDFSQLPTNVIEQAILYNWSGTHFSDRIWANSEKTSAAIKDVIVNGISRGDDVSQMSKQLAKILEASFKAALRLIRTETAFIYNKATVDAYKQSNVVIGHSYLAYLDEKTSNVCRKLDGRKVLYDKEEPKIGVNTPPMHPYCRSTIVPILKKD